MSLLTVSALLAVGCGDDSSPGTAAPTDTETCEAKAESELNVTAGGGAAGVAMKNTLEPWTSQNSVKLNFTEGIAAAGFATVQAGELNRNQQVDLFNGNDTVLALGKVQNTWLPLNMACLPNLAQLDKEIALAKDIVGSPPIGVRFVIFASGIAYNTQVFQQRGWAPPTTWEDLYDPKYASCVIPLSPSVGVNYLQMLNKINSGDYGKYDTTLKRFSDISRSIPAFANNVQQSLELVQSGTGCMTPTLEGRARVQQSLGAPIEFVVPKEGSPFGTGTLSIPKSAPHPQAAMLALNELLNASTGQAYLQGVYLTSVNTQVTRPATGPASKVALISEIRQKNLIDIPLSAFDTLDVVQQRWTQIAAR